MNQQKEPPMDTPFTFTIKNDLPLGKDTDMSLKLKVELLHEDGTLIQASHVDPQGSYSVPLDSVGMVMITRATPVEKPVPQDSVYPAAEADVRAAEEAQAAPVVTDAPADAGTAETPAEAPAEANVEPAPAVADDATPQAPVSA